MILLLVALTLFVFRPVANHDFVNYDDDRYVVKNPYLYEGVSWRGIQWALTADLLKPSPYVDYWQPVTLLSRMVDIKLFGLNPRGHHVVNLILHTFNVILLFDLLWSLTGALGRSVFVAALFAIHPLQVEPVAWITARKDLLYLLFGLLSIKAYSERSRLAILFFLLSLMAKPMLVTLPLLLMLLDFWPLNRITDWKKNLISQWPFFAFSAIFSLIPLIGQSRALQILPLPLLLANLPMRYAGYLGKFFYPAQLAVYSPPPVISISLGPWILIVSLLIGVSIIAILNAKRLPYLAVGWFWFLISLLPTIGSDRFEDRFMYVPIVGLLLLGVWGISDFFARLRFQKILAVLTALVIFGFLTPITFAQVSYWQNSFTLFGRSLQVNPKNFLAQNQLCAAWLDRHDPKKAGPHCAAALKINPSSYQIHYNLALAEEEEGKMDEALRHYSETIRLNPQHFQAHSNIGVLLAKQGKLDEGIFHLKEALRLEPDSAEIHFNLANLLLKQHKTQEAIQHYKEALRLKPDSPSLRQFIGILSPHDAHTA